MDFLSIKAQQPGSFIGDQGKTYMIRASNVGLLVTINFRIQGHKLVQNTYNSPDIHVG